MANHRRRGRFWAMRDPLSRPQRNRRGDRKSASMRQRKQPIRHAQIPGDLVGSAGKPNRRGAAGRQYHLDIRPRDAAAPARPDRFECGLLGGEPGGQMFVPPFSTQSVFSFTLGEAPRQKPIAMPIHHVRDAGHLHQINSMPKKAHDRIVSSIQHSPPGPSLLRPRVLLQRLLHATIRS